MDKKGFTLMELLVVIAILGIMSIIAIPNMIGISDDVKKENMIDDAKKLISLAKYQVNIDYTIRKQNNIEKIYTMRQLDLDSSIKVDPDGGEYDKDASYVKYIKAGNTVSYCIYLKGSVRHIGYGVNSDGNEECITEERLYSKRNVVNY